MAKTKIGRKKKKKSQHKHKVLRENNLLPSEIWAKLMTKKTKPKTKKKKALSNAKQTAELVQCICCWAVLRKDP